MALFSYSGLWCVGSLILSVVFAWNGWSVYACWSSSSLCPSIFCWVLFSPLNGSLLAHAYSSTQVPLFSAIIIIIIIHRHPNAQRIEEEKLWGEALRIGEGGRGERESRIRRGEKCTVYALFGNGERRRWGGGWKEDGRMIRTSLYNDGLAMGTCLGIWGNSIIVAPLHCMHLIMEWIRPSSLVFSSLLLFSSRFSSAVRWKIHLNVNNNHKRQQKQTRREEIQDYSANNYSFIYSFIIQIILINGLAIQSIQDIMIRMMIMES